MMLKNLLRYWPLGAALVCTESYAAAVAPYFTVEEIGIDQADALANANHEITGAGITNQGNYVVGNAMRMRSPFSYYDMNQPYSFAYECQYADTVCDLYWSGADGANDGFGDDYRNALEGAFNAGSGYSSWLFGLRSSDLSSASSTGVTGFDSTFFNVLSDGSGNSVLSKVYINSVTSDDHDTRITSISPTQLSIGGVTTYWVTGYDFDPNNRSTPKGFVESLDGTYHITLTPSYAPASYGGGVSASYALGTDSNGNLTALGLSGVSDNFDNDDDNHFEDCYRREDGSNFSNGDYRVCPGFSTQASAWNLSSVSFTAGNSTTASATLLSSDWLHREDSSTNYSAAALASSNNGIFAGYSTYADGRGDLDGYVRAVLYTYDGTTANRYVLSGTDLVGNDDDNDVRDQWATDLTNPISSNIYVVGNERLTTSDVSSDHNQAVNFFISQIPLTAGALSPSGENVSGTVRWPLRDSPFNGASNQIVAIEHTLGYAVGKRDAENITAYNGIRRRQQAFLFDVLGYMGDSESSGEDHEWSLESLTCYENDSNVAMRPYYRIESARSVVENSTSDGYYVLASGYKYASEDDYIDRNNATPVLLRLYHAGTSAPDNTTLSSCPSYEASTGSYSRSGGAAGWLVLLLIPAAFVRFITKRRETFKAS
ncbi:DUF3466 family protein [Celerinatantimonas sp. YJH-8]|uniref:DUF3466 family protein n=1 Tax=Celerinatantimonas sp. YJH-8 TaxID=3228714 RepID=UPI0038C4D95F